MEHSQPSGCAAGATPCATRRMVLAVAGAAGVGLALTGCQAYGESSGGGNAPAAPPAGGTGTTGGAGTGTPGAGTGTAGTGAAGGAPTFAKTADIPVGGGKIFAGQDVVITQPQAGTFKAFSATCTHAGCKVSEIAGGTINCDCHGSKYKIADGSVARGPAPKGLAAKTVTVSGDSISLG